VLYHDFSYTQVKTSLDCVTSAATLRLPSPTDLQPLLFPSASITDPSLPPSALIDYLDTLPTVRQQLSGAPIESSCDPIVGGTVTLPSTIDSPVVHVTTVPSLYAETITHYILTIPESVALSVVESSMLVPSVSGTRSLVGSRPTPSLPTSNQLTSLTLGPESQAPGVSLIESTQKISTPSSPPFASRPIGTTATTSFDLAFPSTDLSVLFPSQSRDLSFRHTGHQMTASAASMTPSVSFDAPRADGTTATTVLPFPESVATSSQSSNLVLSSASVYEQNAVVETKTITLIDPGRGPAPHGPATQSGSAVRNSTTVAATTSTIIQSSDANDPDSRIGDLGRALAGLLLFAFLLTVLI
jgi:hypothetical protein